MKASEALDKAADILLRDGWYQGQFFRYLRGDSNPMIAPENKTAPCCQDGAINRAVYGLAFPSMQALGREETVAEAKLVKAAATYMGKYVYAHHGQTSAIHWNDQAGRKKKEVVAALRGAAELARAEGK